MAVCEFHEEYAKFLNTRVTDELDPTICKQDIGKVLSVVQHMLLCLSLEQISPEEAKDVYERVSGFYPDFEERLKKEVDGHFD